MTASRYCPVCGARFESEIRFCPHDGAETVKLPDSEDGTPELVGHVVDGRYRIESRLGQGGMGVVYGATHIVLGKPMALKVLRSKAAVDETIVHRFRQEAQAASSIGHPNIIKIHDFGSIPGGDPYIVMERLDGETLTERLKRGALSLEDTVKVASQIASALGAAHARGIIHRDLKPDNVFIVPSSGEDSSVKVLDFGVAKVHGTGSTLTKTGMVFGTPHYMSPEQSAGHPVDARTDVYALGIMIYEMCTGSVPFQAETFMGVLTQHMFEAPIPPTERLPGDTEVATLEPVVLRALAKRPADRYPNMEELGFDLERIGMGQSISPMPMPAPRRSGGSMSLRALVARPPSKKTLWIAGLVVLLAFGAIAGGFFALVQSPSTSPSASKSQGATRPPQLSAAASEGAGEKTLSRLRDAQAEDEVTGSLVQIRSEPDTAMVLIDGDIIGQTPLRLPKPHQGEEAVVELRRTGYKPESITLSFRSENMIQVQLKPQRDDVRSEVRSERRSPVTSRNPSNSSTQPTPTAPRERRPSSPRLRNTTPEILDPWTR